MLFMLSVAIKPIMPNAVMLNVNLPNVVAPLKPTHIVCEFCPRLNKKLPEDIALANYLQ
jgi:hypothetical protein